MTFRELTLTLTQMLYHTFAYLQDIFNSPLRSFWPSFEQKLSMSKTLGFINYGALLEWTYINAQLRTPELRFAYCLIKIGVFLNDGAFGECP